MCSTSRFGAALAYAAQRSPDRLLVTVPVREEAGLLPEAEVADLGRVELLDLGDDVVHLAEGDQRRLDRLVAEVPPAESLRLGLDFATRHVPLRPPNVVRHRARRDGAARL